MAEVIDETERERRKREDAEREARLAQEAAWAAAMENRIEDAPAAPPISYDIQDAPPAPAIDFVPSALAAPELPPSVGAETPFAQPSGIQERLSTGDYTTDSPRYAQEVARARAGSGFLAPDVGPGGNVITPGYDPAVAKAAQRAKEDKLAAQADRFMGVQAYQDCIKNGGKPEECIALHGPKMYGSDVSGLVKLVTAPKPLVKAAPAQKFVPGQVPADVLLQQKQLEKRIASNRADLSRGIKEEEDKDGKLVRKAMTPREKLMLSNKIDADEKAARELIAPGGRLNPAYSKSVDQVGWGNMRQAWENPTPRPPVGAPATTQPSKELTTDIASQFLKAAGGDKAKARKMALDAGYKF